MQLKYLIFILFFYKYWMSMPLYMTAQGNSKKSAIWRQSHAVQIKWFKQKYYIMGNFQNVGETLHFSWLLLLIQMHSYQSCFRAVKKYIFCFLSEDCSSPSVLYIYCIYFGLTFLFRCLLTKKAYFSIRFTRQ